MHTIPFALFSAIFHRLTSANACLVRVAVATTLGVAAVTGTPSAAVAQTATASENTQVHYHTVSVDGVHIFYREAGDRTKPTLLLLHGFPASSHEFRSLLPLLSARFHVVAPDYPGFGFSDAPSAAVFPPTFAHLAQVMGRFAQVVGLGKYTLYLHDFGGPVGFRLAAAHPEQVTGLIIQNANAYEVGIAPDMLKQMRARAEGPLDAKALAGLDQMLSPGGTKFQYLTGVRDVSAIDPTSYSVDSWVQALPEPHRIQQALLVDYYDNIRQYPAWHQYLKVHQPKTLITWGENDPIFLVAGANAYRADLPKADVRFLDTGHFALEEDCARIAEQIIAYFSK